MEFVKYPKIQGLAHVVERLRRFGPVAPTYFGAKIKLHGTNAAVRIKGENVSAQSRTQPISPLNDNCGFAAWVEQHKEAWLAAAKEIADWEQDTDITIFGEWAGKGIQKKDAVTKLDQKYFFVFAAYVDDVVINNPEILEEIIPDLDDILVLPWEATWTDPIDLENPEELEAFAQSINSRVEAIVKRDPFIYGIFGVDGPGEGLVVSPTANPGTTPLLGSLNRHAYESLTFKAKTEKHQVQRTKKAASGTLEVPESVAKFVGMFVTRARVEQAITEACDGQPIPENTGKFLKWVGQDIKSESKMELDKAGLEWKDVAKSVTAAARRLYLDLVKEMNNAA